MAVFWEQGYEGTSISDLLKATGLSKSSLYGTFGDKKELFVAAFNEYRHERGREMLYLLAQQNARKGIERFFYSLFENIGASAINNGCMSVNQAVEMAPRDPEIREMVMADFRNIETALCEAIGRGKTDGSIVNARPANELAKLLLLAFPGLQVMARVGFPMQEIDKTLQVLLANLD
ncbi:TetR/AcrR family transcriptional regulator [Pseudomonas putida]|uniref:TetR/AcrR family transcriptional regulator n=1 Tax=Pseudomonas putida TaxID=303 RepID=UPI0003076BDC|nr:TetR/AcrR family transcriptional regulator [Pseudomonas putida]